MADAARQHVDIAIIGGGIAGSSLAIVLRRSGFSVAVVEREAAFRDRVRGEATHPWGVRELIALDLLDLMREAGARDLPVWVTWRDRQIDESFRWTDADPTSPPEISFSHPAVQTRLLNEAETLGAHVYRPADANVSREGDAWLLDINGDKIAARFLVGADGRRSGIARMLGSTAPPDPTHHKFGGLRIRGHALDPDAAHQAHHDAGFAMVFPQSEDVARVYYVCPTEAAEQFRGPDRVARFMAAVGSTFPVGTFASAEPIGPVAFFPNADVPADVISGDHAVVIGDAAGANDPTQGHGTSLAFRDVRVLRDLLTSSNDWRDVPARYAAARFRAYGICRAHASWVAPLITETGPDADGRRIQVACARAADPSAEGFAAIYLHGPDDLTIDDETRSRFLGENHSVQ